MLRITVEIIPFGDEREKSTLDIMEIINIGGDVNLGNYKIRSDSGIAFELKDYSRRQGFWTLIKNVLIEKGGE